MMPPTVQAIKGFNSTKETKKIAILFSKTPRVLAIRVPNNEDMQNGLQKIEGVLTNSKPKEQVVHLLKFS